MIRRGNPSSLGATLQLRDGRTLGYLEVGAHDGSPLVHCHGDPSSRLEARLLAEQAASLGIRLIGLDRPGIGRSDAKPGFGLLDWPDDVAEVADHLGLERFAVSGLSGGGAFALACAYKMPQRLTACGLISSVPPVAFIRQAGIRGMRVAYWLLERLPPRLFRALVSRTMRTGARSSEADTERTLLRNVARLGAGDQQVVAIPEIRRIYAETAVESYRQGVQANVEDALMLAKRWPFRVEDIAFAPLFLWHGEQDRIMPVAPARLLAQALPQCQATFYPDTGHLCTVVTHAGDILRALGGMTTNWTW
jgi:pimeloyl-ACP methyl ester carboxylesterase